MNTDEMKTAQCTGCSGGMARLTHKASSKCERCARIGVIVATERSRARKRSARASMGQDEWVHELARSRRRRNTQQPSRENTVSDSVDAHIRKLPEVKALIRERCSSRLSSSALKQKVCCVCDCYHSTRDVMSINVNRNKSLVKVMVERLKPPPNLPIALIKHYDLSDLYPALSGILLSRAGADRSSFMQMCSSCYASLRHKRVVHPPKFSIANGLYIGCLPEMFTDTTMTEHAMLNLSQPMHFLSIVRGGKHTSLRSHAYYFRADPATPAQLLPRDVVSEGSIGVTMVGAMTTAQKAATFKKYAVRVRRLKAQLEWYRENNHLYSAVSERAGWEDSFVVDRTRVVLDRSSGGEADGDNTSQCRGKTELDDSTWRHNAPTPAHVAASDQDELCDHTSVALITNFSHIDDSTGVQQVLNKKNVVVYRSSALISDLSPSFWCYAFCELFPYGRGGLDEPRPIQISLHEYVRYCLHSQHWAFSLVAFDVLARHRALRAIYLKGKMSPHSMERAASVSRETLQQYVKYQQDRLEAIAHMRPLPPPPTLDPNLHELYASITAGMRAFWGSNDERSEDRKNLFSMQLKFGQPTIFFTISPDSSSTYRIGHLAGIIPDDVLEHMEANAQHCLALSRAKLGQIASSNPHACAKYFDHIMNVFVDAVLNWDISTGRPRDEPGLFGYTRAYFAATESQNSTGSLHSHMLIWIDNMPSTVDEYYRLCTCENFRTAMLRYVEGIACSNVPLDMTSCPVCVTGRIQAVELQQRAFRKPRKGEQRPTTTKCADCGAEFGGDELIDQHAQRIEAVCHDQNRDQFTLQRIASSRPLPHACSSASEAAVVTRSLLYYQHHHWFHSKSCFKVTKRTPKGNICRMFMPKEPCPETRWTADMRIEMRRDPGNEYVNTYVPTINEIFKCNHDVKFLSAGEGPEKAYYTIKYTTKQQHDIENPWALHLYAYDKSEQRMDDDVQDPVIAGRRRSQSMCCTLSNPHEVSAPMACLYIQRQSAVFSSHVFVKLHLGVLSRTVFERNNPIDVLLEPDSSEVDFKPSSLWLDYRFRPADLEAVNIMDFVALWERKKGKGGLLFDSAHAMHASHSLWRRTKNAVVTISHKRLPDTRRFDLSTTERLRFQQTVMVLFKPFRQSDEFPQNDEAFNDYFQNWWDSDAPPAARTFVTNNVDYYASRELVRNGEDPEVARYTSYQRTTDDYDIGDIGDDSSEEDAESDFQLEEEEDAVIFDQVRTHPTQHIDMLAKTDLVADLAATSTFSESNTLPTILMELEEIERVIQSGPEPLFCEPTAPSIASTNLPDLPTRVRLLQDAIETVPYESLANRFCGIAPQPQCLRDMPSLAEVSYAFELNTKQHKVFTRVGRDLLRSLLADNSTNEQSVTFLGGLPGAGKSRVIAALQALARAWKYPNAVMTAAYQGVAAQSAGGQTIHKLFGWYVNSKKKWKPTQEQKLRFAELKLLILDEISTCDVKILGMVDASLRKLMDRPSSVFGGVHILLVGDWLQQLPVCGVPAFLSARDLLGSRWADKLDSDAYLYRRRGIDAYGSINAVVILDVNMRHKSDPTWRSILAKWRIGRYEQHDLDTVNKIAYEENWVASRASLKGYCPIIVTSNALRVEFNFKTLRAYCQASKNPLHVFSAFVTRQKQPLTSAQRKSLESIRDDKTANMPISLELAIGAVVQCTKNVSTEFKLANGSIGEVIAFIPSSDDVVQRKTVETIEIYHHSRPPEVVFVRLKDFQTHQFVRDLPPGVVPVPKRIEKGVTITMTNRSFSVSIVQVPLVPAFSLTTEKCQGLTVDKMILAPLKHPTRRVPQRSSFYVAVTRVKTLSQLYLMAPLTLEYLDYFKPSADAMKECDRLQAIEDLDSC